MTITQQIRQLWPLLALITAGAVTLGCSGPDSSDLKRVYRDAPVGDYQARFHLDDCGGQTFLQFMKSTIYPAIVAEASNRTPGRHIDGVKGGEGVELRLTADVTTYHVKYKAHWESRAERSGRSFSAVGEKVDGRVDYVADASYAHFFDSFERSLAYDNSFLPDFYRAIFGILTSCDASRFAALDPYQKRLAGDFIAVYIAEQYRHLLDGEGEHLGRYHRWDDALLQTTMLISFHAGQSTMHMYYRNEFTDRTYDQYSSVDGESFCAYRNWNDPRRQQLERRQARLRDYWQPNATCERSGVNITRRDFEKMGYAISGWHKDVSSSLVADALLATLKTVREDLDSRNMYKNVASFYINDATPAELGPLGDEVVENVVSFLTAVYEQAEETTADLLD